ncbi:MAG: glycosyltransferase [Candidatus Lokiarchaeota archaeon]|nr:glycosyltransferase [Candidatus Lokiarchaeota archaeon]MBD3201168.1 glycosyltransferase [Candidatus Lokiarchaeota archaeon]
MKLRKKIRVCFFSHFGYALYNPKSKILFGGAEVQLYLISKMLSKLDLFDIHIILGYNNFNLFKIQKFNKIKLHLSLPIKSNIINQSIGVINLFLTLAKINPDVIIQRGGSIPTGLIALFSKIFRKKFIFSIAHKNDVIKGGKDFPIQIFYNFGLKNCNYIIAQSRDQISLLEEEKCLSNRNIKLIKSGYDLGSFQKEEKDFILWVGRAVYWKRPYLYLKLARDIPDENFVMICPLFEDKELFDNLKQEAQEISNLTYIDYVPFNHINQYFESAKIFINTSIKEGFPNTFIQASKNGTPILSLKVDPDNILDRYEIGHSFNDDYNRLKGRIITLLKENQKYSKLSNNCFQYAKRNHNIKKISDKWKYVIISMIKN